jgi:type III restriction enzyme
VESFFERPILSSPYAYPDRHWELDDDGRPTNNTSQNTAIPNSKPRPRSHRNGVARPQTELVFDSGHGLSTEEQEYNPTPTKSGTVKTAASYQNPDQWERSRACDIGIAIRPHEGVAALLTVVRAKRKVKE